MPVKSMTGYGAGRFTVGDDTYRVEIRAVNHRHLDLKPRLPREFAPAEPKLREAISARLKRGHVNVNVAPEKGASATPDVHLNVQLAARVRDALDDLRGRLGLGGSVTLDHLMRVDGVLQATPKDVDPAAAATGLLAGVAQALEDLDAMRKAEGERLARDIRGRVVALESLLGSIEAEVPRMLEAYRARLRQRLEELAEGMETTWREERLEAEMALFVDRSDVAEEITRARSHLEAVRKLLAGDDNEPCGRKLEFLAIELNREFNTTGSKTGSAGLSHLVVEAKSEVERIREQVANIE